MTRPSNRLLPGCRRRNRRLDTGKFEGSAGEQIRRARASVRRVADPLVGPGVRGERETRSATSRGTVGANIWSPTAVRAWRDR